MNDCTPSPQDLVKFEQISLSAYHMICTCWMLELEKKKDTPYHSFRLLQGYSFSRE